MLKTVILALEDWLNILIRPGQTPQKENLDYQNMMPMRLFPLYREMLLKALFLNGMLQDTVGADNIQKLRLWRSFCLRKS